MSHSITNRERASQLIHFDDMHWGRIAPTDLDGLIELKDKAFIMTEVKVKGTRLPVGQRIALERLSDTLESAGKYSLLIIGTHRTKTDKDVNLGTCSVMQYRTKGVWHRDFEGTVRELCDKFIAEWGILL